MFPGVTAPDGTDVRCTKLKPPAKGVVLLTLAQCVMLQVHLRPCVERKPLDYLLTLLLRQRNSLLISFAVVFLYRFLKCNGSLDHCFPIVAVIETHPAQLGTGYSRKGNNARNRQP
jgi:hypothetical protein